VDARHLLEEERRSTLERLSSLEADFGGIVAASEGSNADDEHDPEGATIAFERSQVSTLVRQAQRHLQEIEAALQRVEDGSYGRCERCGEPIPEARLEARPVARTCVGCT
jgi:RNA polymerase-binding protein DksA